MWHPSQGQSPGNIVYDVIWIPTVQADSKSFVRQKHCKVKTKINLRLETDSRTAQIVLIDNEKKYFF